MKKFFVIIRFFFRKYFLNKIRCEFNNKLEIANTEIINNKIYVIGTGNEINIKARTIIHNLFIKVRGTNNKLFIENDCKILSGSIKILGDDLNFSIGKNTTIRSFDSNLVGKGSFIKIGKDCMFGSDIKIWNGEIHPIYSKETKIRVNKPKNIKIGDHVWIGSEVIILKDSLIEDGSVVGIRSIVKGNVSKNTVVVGSPLKKIRKNIEWKRI